jgi:transposase
MWGGSVTTKGSCFIHLASLEEVVPDDHLVRKIAAVLDLSWVHAELAPHYPNNGRPSIDPELMIRMLIIGYVFAVRSERALCRDVQVNLALSLVLRALNRRQDSGSFCVLTGTQ